MTVYDVIFKIQDIDTIKARIDEVIDDEKLCVQLVDTLCEYKELLKDMKVVPYGKE